MSGINGDDSARLSALYGGRAQATGLMAACDKERPEGFECFHPVLEVRGEKDKVTGKRGKFNIAAGAVRIARTPPHQLVFMNEGKSHTIPKEPLVKRLGDFSNADAAEENNSNDGEAKRSAPKPKRQSRQIAEEFEHEERKGKTEKLLGTALVIGGNILKNWGETTEEHEKGGQKYSDVLGRVIIGAAAEHFAVETSKETLGKFVKKILK